MGGTNEIKAYGLRFHENSGKVHIHNDSENIKFELSTKLFKQKIQQALNDLETTDGIIKISGETKVELYIIKDSSRFLIFLSDSSTSYNNAYLTEFIKGLSK
jgi:hypothetical protein